MEFRKKEKQTANNNPNETPDSRRKNTGRTDKYSDDTPLKDFQDYQRDDKSKTARIDMKKDGKIDKQVKSIDYVKQEIKSCVENYIETFNSAQFNEWQNKLSTLIHELEKFKK